MNIIQRSINSLRLRGVKGSFERLIRGNKLDIIGNYPYIAIRDEVPFNKQDFLKAADEPVTLNWVIPEMEKGSGGHTTIFRFVNYFESHGIHNRVYLFYPERFHSDKEIRDFLLKNFKVDPRVEIYCDSNNMKFAHGTIATGWNTAYGVRLFNNTISKFYFVQDYEPWFFAKGSYYELAENTYRFGLYGITAGDWLKDVCRNQYGMKAESFGFSYDKNIYQPKKKTDNVKRVFFYARPVTPRRDFELGLFALNELHKKMPDVEIVFAGWNTSTILIPFPHVSHGVCTAQQLAEIYQSSDLCLVLSGTNLSLLPLEVMACGSVVVCTKGPNSEWLVNDENAVLVDYDPIAMADVLEEYLKDDAKREAIRNKGLEFAKTTSWEAEEEKIRNVIINTISEDSEKLKF